MGELPKGKTRIVDEEGHVQEVAESSTSTGTKKTIAAATTVILAANADREYAAFVNDSDEVQYIKLGGAAVLNEGIRLNANGGSYEITPQNRFLGAVNGICTSGGKNMTVTEY